MNNGSIPRHHRSLIIRRDNRFGERKSSFTLSHRLQEDRIQRSPEHVDQQSLDTHIHIPSLRATDEAAHVLLGASGAQSKSRITILVTMSEKVERRPNTGQAFRPRCQKWTISRQLTALLRHLLSSPHRLWQTAQNLLKYMQHQSTQIVLLWTP
jgi:hypothetical protein